MSTVEIISLLEKFADKLHIATWLRSAGREIYWEIIKGLSWILDSITGGQSLMLKLINFYKSPVFLTFIGKYSIVISGLATLAILWLAFKMSSSGTADRKANIDKYVENTIVALLLTVGLPSMISLMLGIFTPAANETLSNSANSVQIYKNNITDLYGLDNNGWKKIETVNSIKDKKDLIYIDITEQVDTGGFLFDDSPLSSEGKELLEKKLTLVDGKATTAKLKSRFISGDEAYLRYSWHPNMMIVELLIRTAIGLFVLYSIASKGLELAFVSGLLQVSAWTDLENGKRNRDLFMHIRNMLIVLYITLLLQSLFTLFVSYMGTLGLNPLLKLVGMFSAGIFVIGGPSVVEQVFGQDAGVGSNIGSTLMGLGQGARMLSGVGRAGASVAKKGLGLGKTAAKGLGYVGAGGAGVFSGLASSDDTSKTPLTPQGKEGKENTPSSGVNSGNEPTKGNSDSPLGKSSEGNEPSNSPVSGNSDTKGSGITPLGAGGDSKEPSSTPLGGNANSNEPSSTPLSGNDKNKESPSTPLGGNANSKESSNTPLGGGNETKESPTTQLGGSSYNKEPESTPLGSGSNASANLSGQDNATPDTQRSSDPQATPLRSKESAPQKQQETAKKRDLPYTPSSSDNLSQVLKGNARNKSAKLGNSSYQQRTKRVYDVSKNTTRSLKQTVRKGINSDKGGLKK